MVIGNETMPLPPLLMFLKKQLVNVKKQEYTKGRIKISEERRKKT